MVWLYRSPILVRRRGIFYSMISTCLRALRKGGGGWAPWVKNQVSEFKKCQILARLLLSLIRYYGASLCPLLLFYNLTFWRSFFYYATFLVWITYKYFSLEIYSCIAIVLPLANIFLSARWLALRSTILQIRNRSLVWDYYHFHEVPVAVELVTSLQKISSVRPQPSWNSHFYQEIPNKLLEIL